MIPQLPTFSRNETGSLSLEQVLFIGAVLAASVGLFSFYGGLSTYFSSVDISALQTTPNMNP